jgi:Uma2 family endonuclease
MYYLDGRIEIFSLASIHEFRKKLLARLLEHWALETGNDVEGFGSWTLEDEEEEAAAEPDECYVIGHARKDVPDLVIEVEWSRVLGLPKQEIYKRLGVRELWTITNEAKLVIRVLERGRWVVRTRSKVLPALDVVWLFSFTSHPRQSDAVRALRDAMHAKRKRR